MRKLAHVLGNILGFIFAVGIFVVVVLIVMKAIIALVGWL